MRILSLALVAAAWGPIRAQLPVQSPPDRSIVQDLRVEARTIGLTRAPLVAQASDGRLIVAPRAGGPGEIRMIDSAGHPLPWSVKTGDRDADVLFPSRVGWIPGTTMTWILDPGFRQVALVDAAGKVVKSLESSPWVHPHWAQRRTYPVFGGMEAVAVYPDTTMLVIPVRPKSLLDTPGYDRSQPRLLRVTWSGAIERSVAVLPKELDRIVFNRRDCQHVIMLPWVPRPTWATSSDGKRIVIATAGVSTADSGTVRVVALDERGDTVFARRVAQPAVRLTQTTYQSLLDHTRDCGSISAAQIRDSITRRMPAFRSFVTNVVVGRDYSTWITMRAVDDTSHASSAILLDAGGNAVARVELPANQELVAGDRQRVWTLELGERRAVNALLRYKLEPTAAPPSRSG
jgi:hypothetical protein